MRGFNRQHFRAQQLLERLESVAPAEQPLWRDAVTMQLFRAYLSLLSGLCDLYRIGGTITGNRATEQSYITALADFNDGMYELHILAQAKAQPNHWLAHLLVEWQMLWQEPSTERSADPSHARTSVIVSDRPDTWHAEALAGLKAMAADFREHSQTY